MMLTCCKSDLLGADKLQEKRSFKVSSGTGVLWNWRHDRCPNCRTWVLEADCCRTNSICSANELIDRDNKKKQIQVFKIINLFFIYS